MLAGPVAVAPRPLAAVDVVNVRPYVGKPTKSFSTGAPWSLQYLIAKSFEREKNNILYNAIIILIIFCSEIYMNVVESFTHHIVIYVITLIYGAAVQRAVVTSEWVPGSVVVVGHDVYKV